MSGNKHAETTVCGCGIEKGTKYCQTRDPVLVSCVASITADRVRAAVVEVGDLGSSQRTYLVDADTLVRHHVLLAYRLHIPDVVEPLRQTRVDTARERSAGEKGAKTWRGLEGARLPPCVRYASIGSQIYIPETRGALAGMLGCRSDHHRPGPRH